MPTNGVEKTHDIHVHAPSLQSTLHGQVDEAGIATFRGVPFATLKQRWTQSTVKNNLDASFDATQFGPRCPQPDGPVLVSGGTVDPVPGDDEFECLNLNIALPNGHLPVEHSKPKSLLPTMVWIHGGAFNYGANSVARYRPSAFCAHALLINKPVVLVQINYRLGPLGFAMSSDLSSDDTSEAGQQDTPRYRGNFGLIDQRNALEWVQSHIRDFGGDPERVTTFGVSAGSASIHYHILTGQPLFDRAIMMSGTAGSLGPLPLSLYQQEWDKISAACGLTSESATMRLAALRDLNVDELLKAYTQKAFGPYGDGELLPTSWTYTDKLPISSTSRCNSIILGDTRVEGVIFDGFARRMPQQAFYSLLEQYLPDQQTREEFCRVFKFTKDSSSSLAEANLTEIAYRDALRLFFSVATFQFPTLRVAETFPTSGDDDDDKATNRRRAYMYHFEENSPYPGPTKGLSYHGQDALYLHLNEAGTTDFPDSAVELSKRMLEAWVGFAYGAEPWPAYRSEEQGAQGRFMRWGPDGRNEMMTFEQDEMRPYGCLEWARQHWMDMQRLVRRLLHES